MPNTRYISQRTVTRVKRLAKEINGTNGTNGTNDIKYTQCLNLATQKITGLYTYKLMLEMVSEQSASSNLIDVKKGLNWFRLQKDGGWRKIIEHEKASDTDCVSLSAKDLEIFHNYKGIAPVGTAYICNNSLVGLEPGSRAYVKALVCAHHESLKKCK